MKNACLSLFVSDPPVINNTTSARLTGFDAARGTAMLLVCVSHFLDMYFLAERLPPAERPQIGELVGYVVLACRMATPTFFLVSGLVLGYLYRTKGSQFGALRLHLLDKALFLATIGHVLIAIFTAARSGLSLSISEGYVTDTLAVCVIGSLLLLPRTAATTRLWLGLALYLVSWTGWYFWHPDAPPLNTLKCIFLGPQEDGTTIFYFPLLPWFGVHLIGGYLGEHFSQYRSDDLYWQISKRLGTLAATAVLAALATKIIYTTLADLALFTPTASLLRFVSFWQKHPPGPLYLLLLGGGALFIISGLLFAERAQWIRCYLRLAETVGRNSLLAFLLQYFVYYTVFYMLVTQTSLITPWMAVGFLLVSLLGQLAVIAWLDRCHINHAWTVGLPRLVQSWPRLALPVCAPSSRAPLKPLKKHNAEC